MKKFSFVSIAVIAGILFGAYGVHQTRAALTMAALTITSDSTLAVNAAAASNMTIGSAQVAGTITIGGSAGTGNITLGSSTAAQTVLIGNGVNAAAQEVDIANGATAAASTVKILSGTGTAGVGTLNMGDNPRMTTISLGNGANAAAMALNIASGAAAANRTVTISGGVPTAGTDTLNLATGDYAKAINIATGNNVANVLTIGDNVLANSTTTVQIGGAITLNGAANYVADTGAADAYVATFAPAITAYTPGLEIRVKISAANTVVAPTINVNGLGAKTIVKRAATALAAGDMPTGGIAVLIYDGTNFQLINPVVN